MKYIDFYKNSLHCSNTDEIFKYILENLKPSMMLWSYFVNWQKVFDNVNEIEVCLNILNSLIGKKDFDNEFRYILNKYPDCLSVIPLLAVRITTKKKMKKGDESPYQIITDYSNMHLNYETFDFSNRNITPGDLDKYLLFVEKTGIKDLFVQHKIRNVVDYIIGVEAGLDSNARKNRSGKMMEEVVEYFISNLCQRKGYEYLNHPKPREVTNKWKIQYEISGLKDKQVDFIIYNKKDLYLIETNFYGGPGSKPYSICREYINMYNAVKDDYIFIWITDGMGLKTFKKDLRESFDHMDYLLSLNMLEKGILDEIIV